MPKPSRTTVTGGILIEQGHRRSRSSGTVHATGNGWGLQVQASKESSVSNVGLLDRTVRRLPAQTYND